MDQIYAGKMFLPTTYVLGETDVICGRGRTCFNHIGNTRFREVVLSQLPRYLNAKTKTDKTIIIYEIVNYIRKTSVTAGGGFVKRDKSTGRYFEVGDSLAREKTSQAFRDILHEQYKSSNANKRSVRKAMKDHKVDGENTYDLCSGRSMSSNQDDDNASNHNNHSSLISQSSSNSANNIKSSTLVPSPWQSKSPSMGESSRGSSNNNNDAAAHQNNAAVNHASNVPNTSAYAWKNLPPAVPDNNSNNNNNAQFSSNGANNMTTADTSISYLDMAQNQANIQSWAGNATVDALQRSTQFQNPQLQNDNLIINESDRRSITYQIQQQQQQQQQQLLQQQQLQQQQLQLQQQIQLQQQQQQLQKQHQHQVQQQQQTNQSIQSSGLNKRFSLTSCFVPVDDWMTNNNNNASSSRTPAMDSSFNNLSNQQRTASVGDFILSNTYDERSFSNSVDIGELLSLLRQTE